MNLGVSIAILKEVGFETSLLHSLGIPVSYVQWNTFQFFM